MLYFRKWGGWGRAGVDEITEVERKTCHTSVNEAAEVVLGLTRLRKWREKLAILP